MSVDKQQICDKLLDSIVAMDMENLSSIDMEHLQGCELCQETLEAMNQLKAAGSPFKSEYYPIKAEALKNRILTQTSPILNSMAKANKSSSSSEWNLMLLINQFRKPLLAFASFCVVIGLLAYILSSNANHSSVLSNELHKPLKLASIQLQDSAEYKIIKNNEVKLIPLDNPISLFDGERIDLELPDGSEASLAGPARISICQRGFHLIQGELFIQVKKADKPFKASTPHCEIEVLGTSFSCKVNAKETQINVKTGAVAVTSNEGTTNVLKAGDSAQIKDKKPKSHSDCIAPKDSE
jgi:hypothetical protein